MSEYRAMRFFKKRRTSIFLFIALAQLLIPPKVFSQDSLLFFGKYKHLFSLQLIFSEGLYAPSAALEENCQEYFVHGTNPNPNWFRYLSTGDKPYPTRMVVVPHCRKFRLGEQSGSTIRWAEKSAYSPPKTDFQISKSSGSDEGKLTAGDIFKVKFRIDLSHFPDSIRSRMQFRPHYMILSERGMNCWRVVFQEGELNLNDKLETQIIVNEQCIRFIQPRILLAIIPTFYIQQNDSGYWIEPRDPEKKFLVLEQLRPKDGDYSGPNLSRPGFEKLPARLRGK